MKFGTMTHIGPWQWIWNFEFLKPKITAAAILKKSQKSWYLRNGLTDLYEIWYADAKWACKPLWLLKGLNLTNPRWRTAAILKTVKSPSLQPCDRFWWNWARWRILAPYSWLTVLKFRIFENPRWRRQPTWKSQKSRYLQSDLYEIWYANAKWAYKPLWLLKNWISKIQDGGQLSF